MTNNVNTAEEGEWQQAPTKKKNTKSKRAYIGNFRPDCTDLESKLRSHIAELGVAVDEENGDADGSGVTIVTRDKFSYALVKCDVSLAIKLLNRTEFDGRPLKVSVEKVVASGGGNKNRKKNGFGRGWASGGPTKNDPTKPRTGPVVPPKDSDTDDPPTNPDFHSRKELPISDLLSEYGQQDPNWDDPVPPTTTNDPSSSSSSLAPRGKAPIHVQLLSFGYKYGTPPSSSRTHSQPLPAFDSRPLLSPVPKHLLRLTGTHPAVKRALKNNFASEDETTAGGAPRKQRDGASVHAKTLAEEVLAALREAVEEGGYGYAAPLTMTVHVGSELGRHRGVTLAEMAAIQVRNGLRRGEVGTGVSVGTGHRDVEKKVGVTKLRDEVESV